MMGGSLDGDVGQGKKALRPIPGFFELSILQTFDQAMNQLL
jgi:hypothetical protein